MTEPCDIPGWPTLMEWFGYSPNFHDAEVVSVDLRRAPETSVVRVLAWRTNDDLTGEGHYRQDRHAIATFSLRGITALRLNGWGHQNVLSELSVDRTEDGFTLHLPEIYGVDGEISATEISVSVKPTDTPVR